MTTWRQLRRADLELPLLGLGTAPLGGLYAAVAREQAVATVDAAYELGVRYFDTAPLYGYGLAERHLGEALASRPRDFLLSTKVGRLLRDAQPDPSLFHDGVPYYHGTPPVSPVFDFSRDGVLASLAESRARLGVEQLDIAFVHDPDRHSDQALREACPTLEALRAGGELRAIGVGMNQWEALADWVRETSIDCILLAGRYTLLDTSALATLLPLCERMGVGVIAGGVYNSGILARPEPGTTFDYVAAPPQVLAKAQALQRVCAQFDVPLMAAALQFVAAHPAVVSVLVGARTPAEIRQNVAMLAHSVPDRLWATLRRRGLLPHDAPIPVLGAGQNPIG